MAIVTDQVEDVNIDPSVADAADKRRLSAGAAISVALLTGCQDRPYAFGLAMSLAAHGVKLDIIGSDEVDSPEFHTSPTLRFLNLRGTQKLKAGAGTRLGKLLVYYVRLLVYAATAKPKVFHILWNNRFELFDRTLLMMYFKLLGKRVTLTAHNVNAARRDAKDSWMNRATLRIQYRLVDHIFVHTQKMKSELVQDFEVRASNITVLTHPINDAFPDTNLTPAEAKHRLGVANEAKTILFFGRIRPYKGLEYLVEAFKQIVATDPSYRLIIAGEHKKGSEEYSAEIEALIKDGVASGVIIPRMEFIPDAETEVYFKAADILALPYKEIFQSGVLFLSYSFGLPVVATEVGSFDEGVIEGKTGFVCKACDSASLAGAIQKYFASDLYRNLAVRRKEIRDYAYAEHSWEAVARLTVKAYAGLPSEQR